MNTDLGTLITKLIAAAQRSENTSLFLKRWGGTNVILVSTGSETEKLLREAEVTLYPSPLNEAMHHVNKDNLLHALGEDYYHRLEDVLSNSCSSQRACAVAGYSR